jgi:hypothetical protein
MNAPLPNALQKAAEDDERTAENALALIKANPITTPAAYEEAGGELKEIKAELQRIKGIRDAAVKPMQQAIDTVKSWFARPLELLTEAEKLRKSEMVTFLQVQREAEQKALQATRAAVLAGDGAAAAAALATIQPSAPKVAGVNARENWTFEITDVDAIPREFMMPNEQAIRAFVKASKRADCIPGVRAYPETILSARSK